MTKRMLIDGTHAEETRVVVLDGNRLEDFDVETATKKQLKGNIYLAKIVRVEPSLQAAFVEYGGNRHGFLAFGEIHPDYYQIPVADRQRLIAQQEQEAREAEAEEDAAARADELAGPAPAPTPDEPDEHDGPDAQPLAIHQDRLQAPAEGQADDFADAEPAHPALQTLQPAHDTADHTQHDDHAQDDDHTHDDAHSQNGAAADQAMFAAEDTSFDFNPAQDPAEDPAEDPTEDFAEDDSEFEDAIDITADSIFTELGLELDENGEITGDPQALTALAQALSGALFEPSEPGQATDTTNPTDPSDTTANQPGQDPATQTTPAPENLGGEDADRRPASPRYLRNYKIQEVIRRRQIILIQVVKEERGGKGAALTTYISLAGRFCVLMPNSPRGGGISRKITSSADRKRLKDITTGLDIPSGMGLIVRTAGAARPKPEIVRDCEYLLQLWDDIRDTTLKSVAPAAIYEEASLIKRAIRDGYSRDIDEVQVDGEAAWQAARDQMRLLMPGHAHKVQLWHDPSGQKLFAHHQVDAQLDAMLSPTVQLKSGGYLVINQTEALVAIDVNSGRSTRERGIEETALRTNLEASDEIARQLRLRDLAGLIVIDYIDMEQRRHNAMVEKRLKEALRDDRARIQLGSISAFGLMEMSRQRLRPSFAETSFVQCSHCTGTGLVRSTEGAAIHVLRAIEEEGGKRRSAEIMVHVAAPVALHILNHMRDRLRAIEQRYGMITLFTPDPNLLPPALRIDKLRTHAPGEAPPLEAPRPVQPSAPRDLSTPRDTMEPDTDDLAFDDEDTTTTPLSAASSGETSPDGATAAEGEASRRRRRRRRRGGRREDGTREDGPQDSTREQAVQADAPPRAPDAEQPDIMTPSDIAPDQPATQSAAPDGTMPADFASTDSASTDSASRDFASGEAGRRRGRRGGRRRRRDGDGDAEVEQSVLTAAYTGPAQTQAPSPAPYTAPTYNAPIYTGPTPADPFGGGGFDIFDVMEQAETQAEQQAAALARPTPPPPPPPAPAPAPAVAVTAKPAKPAPTPAPAPEAMTQPATAAPEETPELPLAATQEAKTPPEDTPPTPLPEAPAKRVRAPRTRARAKPAAEPSPDLMPEPAPEPSPEPSLEPAPQPAAAEPPPAEPTAEPPPAPKRGWWKR